MAKRKPAADQTAPGPTRRPVAPPRPLRLEYRTREELADNPANWRRHPPNQLAALKDLVAEVGWAGAVLYNEQTGRLIDGHARKDVTPAGQPIPVLVGSWSAQDEAKILATLDPVGAMAAADQKALEALLADVQTQSEPINQMLAELLAESTAATIEAAAAAEEPEAAGEPDASPYQQFSVPLTMAQEAFVREAIRTAKERSGLDSSGDALHFLVQEWVHAQPA